MDLEIPPVQVQKRETTVSDIVAKEKPFGTDQISSSSSQQDGSLCSAPVEPTANIVYESLYCGNTCESSTFGTPFEVKNSGTLPNQGSCVCFHGLHGRDSFLDCWNVNPDETHINATSDFNFNTYGSILHSVSEAPPIILPQRHTQEFMEEAYSLIFSDPESVDLSPVRENHDNSMIDFGEDFLAAASTEPRMSISSLASEDWKVEEFLECGKPRLATNAQPLSSQIESSKKSWACPWYKKDSLKYHTCSKYKLQRIKDVKQHTWRKHMKPDYYCPVCYIVFSTSDERDGHVQKKSCDSQPKPEFDGITDELRKELNQPANRGKNEREQWYIMWDTIFPGVTRPQSPYIGNAWESLVPLLRHVWNERRQEIIHKSHRSLSDLDPEITPRIVDDFLDFLEEESSCRNSDLDLDVSSTNPPCKIKEEESTISGTSHDIDMVSSDLAQYSGNTTTSLEEKPMFFTSDNKS
ncbi:hypothetical protein F4806DRAFT_507635 [Annulohypoxylon nitens]|nr:hypothetical protein F4806DRAFT_507635 [Annulohypoxylon nitens]